MADIGFGERGRQGKTEPGAARRHGRRANRANGESVFPKAFRPGERGFIRSGHDRNDLRVARQNIESFLAQPLAQPARNRLQVGPFGVHGASGRDRGANLTGQIRRRCRAEYERAGAVHEQFPEHTAGADKRAGASQGLAACMHNSQQFPLDAEGAGGVMVPINDRELMTDLMRHLNLPAIVAARSTLGTINHTLLTFAALERAGVEIVGAVLIGPENSDNRAAIERYGGHRVVGRIPMLDPLGREALLEAFRTKFDPQVFA